LVATILVGFLTTLAADLIGHLGCFTFGVRMFVVGLVLMALGLRLPGKKKKQKGKEKRNVQQQNNKIINNLI